MHEHTTRHPQWRPNIPSASVSTKLMWWVFGAQAGYENIVGLKGGFYSWFA